jgi:hypothetical protein
MLKNLLMYRFIIFNSLMTGLMAWLASKGYLSLVVASDPTGISLGIAALFLLSGAATTIQAWKITREKNAHKEGRYTAKDKAKRQIKLGRISRASDAMALLGIIGTVVGFIIAFATTDPSSLLNASDVSTGVAQIMKGMGIALYTTLTGAVLGGWTGENFNMLKEQVDILEVDENDS